jgi:hypothetical protein
VKTRLHWTDRTLVTCPIFYAVCTSEADFKHELKRLNVKEETPFMSTTHAHMTTHHFGCDEKSLCIVCVGSLKGRLLVEIIGLFAHEATHIWQAVRDHIGEHKPGTEFEAYSIQWITQQLIESWAAKDKRGRVLMK